MNFNLSDNANFIFVAIILVLAVLIRVLRFQAAKSTYSHLSGNTLGVNGAAQCNSCGEVFPLGMLVLRFGFGSLFTRCPNCGHWGFVQRLSAQELQEIDRVMAAKQTVTEDTAKSDEEKMKKLIDESKYSK